MALTEPHASARWPSVSPKSHKHLIYGPERKIPWETFIIELMAKNSFGAASKLRAGDRDFEYFRLASLAEKGLGSVDRLPFSIKILLENLLRNEDGRRVS